MRCAWYVSAARLVRVADISSRTEMVWTSPTPRTESRRRPLRLLIRGSRPSTKSSESYLFSSAETIAELTYRAAKFASVTSLALFFPHNISEGDDEETTRVYYVGLRGSWRPVSWKLSGWIEADPQLPNALGQIVYEAAPRPTDHKVQGDAMAAAPRQGF